MSTKRKERADDDVELESPSGVPENSSGQPHISGSTLFVSNLPYTATSVDLQTLFSDIAPVRSAFVVLDKETHKSKGVGYVSFAIKEDATSAVENVKQKGIMMDKRSLRVQFADNKTLSSHDNGKTIIPNPKRGKQISTHKHPGDPNAIRTAVISGLPKLENAKALWKKVRKFDGAEEISQWPGKNFSGDEDPTIAEVLFSTTTAAQDFISRLHAHVFKGSLLSVVLKKRIEALDKSSGNPSRASRLIVRNLPWSVTDADLRGTFLPYGPIHSITIPVSESDEKTNSLRAKGFAFVWMMNRSDAEKAIEGANGTVIGIGNKSDVDTKGKERIIAVDWALSKERWEVEKKKIVGSEAEGSDSSRTDNDSESESLDTESDDGYLDIHEQSDRESYDEEASSSVQRSDGEEEAERPRLPPPDTGNTIFIRNIPFDATEDELRVIFRAFGPLRYARITSDPATGRGRGTGFVCFWNKEDADKAIKQAELLQNETGLQDSPVIKNPFKISILSHDPSSSLAQNLVMHGRTLNVTRAVTREEAQKLREMGEKQRQKQDKRNLYLMREGVIFPNTPAAASLNPAEVEKRVQAFNSRRTLLRSNPSLYVSKTRLSVRQIPTFVSERTLKRLALHAVRAFEEDVKMGERDGLTAEELQENQDFSVTLAGEGKNSGQKRKHKFGERYTVVRQAKIVRIGDRVDLITGKGRSKGYGFLEMMTHIDALRVLRWANNNPEVKSLLKAWWKEELADLFERLNGGSNKTEEDQARMKRIQDRIHELEQNFENSWKMGRTLVLEFSIENIQVVRRRVEREKGRKFIPEVATEKRRNDTFQEENSRPSKKLKKDTLSLSEPPSTESKAEPESKLGNLIQRKRRQKKMKRKA